MNAQQLVRWCLARGVQQYNVTKVSVVQLA